MYQHDELKNYLNTFYDSSSNSSSVLLYGNKILYGLMRYIQMLYARMDYAYPLCGKIDGGLYNDSKRTNDETQSKMNYFYVVCIIVYC